MLEHLVSTVVVRDKFYFNFCVWCLMFSRKYTVQMEFLSVNIQGRNEIGFMFIFIYCAVLGEKSFGYNRRDLVFVL